MNRFASPKAILRQFKDFPVNLTVEDPISQNPITITYENLHSLLALDVNNLTFEAQVVSNVYAEMARFERAAKWEAERAEGRYRAWKVAMSKELADNMPEKKTAKGARAAKQGPTVAEVEAYYRDHKDYEQYALAGKRMEAISALFGDLKWAFKMKAEMLSNQAQMMAGFESTVRSEEHSAETAERLADYQNLAMEAASIAASSNVYQDAQETLSGKDPVAPASKPKSPRAL